MKKEIDEQKIETLLTRGVENIYPSKEYLRSRLTSGERLKIYLGIDPTGPTLHLGHLIPLLKLRDFQQLGHQIILLIGDFTATIGDPTDKTATRVPLSKEQVILNAHLYKKQAGKIISFDGENPAVLRHNSEWLSKLSFSETLELASKVTYAQTIKRDMFQKRIAEGRDLYLHEFLYPLMQGYDSVAMDVDGEVGGSDQTFNMLMGRDLMKKMKGKEKFVITTKLLVDTEGSKMGKTTGNMVSFLDSPEDIYGKVMSWNDNMILPGMELCTDIPNEEISFIKNKISEGEINPKEYKMRLAREIVELYCDRDSADRVEEEWINVFQKKGVPDDMLMVEAHEDKEIVAILLENEVVKSKSDFRRLLDEGAISLNNAKIQDPQTKVGDGGIIKVGKKRFIKVEVSKR